jgi:sulfate transport system substrate-binding protein
MSFKKVVVTTAIAALAFTGIATHSATPVAKAAGNKYKLLNVSYDPTRELYKAINPKFAKYYKAKTGDSVTIQQSHGGSGSQARKVIDGLNADVVTLALEGDVNAIQKSGLIDSGWVKELPNSSAPYTSTIVLLVRKGNPKNIKDWDDLAKDGVKVITPNPKTSGGARWNFLAAYGYALKKYNNDEDKAKDFVKKIYKNVAVLDSGARASTNTFVQNGIGDVLIAWENEALLTKNDSATKGKKFKIVYPSQSILAEPSVAVVDSNARHNGTEVVAKEYLKYLYTPAAQEIIAKNYYRPRNKTILNQYVKQGFYKDIPLIDIDSFGGWDAAQKKFFDDGGVFDKIYN